MMLKYIFLNLLSLFIKSLVHKEVDFNFTSRGFDHNICNHSISYSGSSEHVSICTFMPSPPWVVPLYTPMANYSTAKLERVSVPTLKNAKHRSAKLPAHLLGIEIGYLISLNDERSAGPSRF